MSMVDRFYENYLCGFEIRGQHTDDIEDFYRLYKSLVLNASSVDEIIAVVKEFKFYTADINVDILRKYDLPTLHSVMNSTGEIPVELYCFKLPPVMLHAKVIADEVQAPQHVAAMQYVVSQLMNIEDIQNAHRS